MKALGCATVLALIVGAILGALVLTGTSSQPQPVPVVPQSAPLTDSQMTATAIIFEATQTQAASFQITATAIIAGATGTQAARETVEAGGVPTSAP